MKTSPILLTLIFLIILPFNIIAKNHSHDISSNTSGNDLQSIEKEVEKRWTKVKKSKKNFAPYSNKKSKKEISKEFKKLKQFRKKLWYRKPDKSSSPRNKDYLIPEATKKNKYNAISSIHSPFAYNCASYNYNASHILIDDLHFIATQGPSGKNLPTFFQILIENNVKILVRLKPEKEYLKSKSSFYWTNYLIEGSECSFILPQIPQQTPLKKSAIPYFYTNTWEDNQAIDVKELYTLVESVRKKYNSVNKKGPIACHCAAGVGRAGTFIAAYVLAHKLDSMNPKKLSIEEVVLKLSIQRPLMVSVTEQYSLLYEFVDYFLKQKQTS